MTTNRSPEPHRFQTDQTMPACIDREHAIQLGYRVVSAGLWHAFTHDEQDVFLEQELQVVAARGTEPGRHLPMANASYASKYLACYHERDHPAVFGTAEDDEEAIA